MYSSGFVFLWCCVNFVLFCRHAKCIYSLVKRRINVAVHGYSIVLQRTRNTLPYDRIVGSTKVDLLARIHSLSPITNIPILWQSRWNLYPNNKLYKIYPNVSTLPPLPNTFTRKEQTTLNRLLIGHSHLTHSYLIN